MIPAPPTRRVAYPLERPTGDPGPTTRAPVPTRSELVDALWDLALSASQSAAADEPELRAACERAMQLIDRCRQ